MEDVHFPDSKTGAYLLPVKRAVRVADHLETGDEVRAHLRIVDAESGV
jgi:Domain of unknown function (DUF1905)